MPKALDLLKEYTQGPHVPAPEAGNIFDGAKHRWVSPKKDIAINSNSHEPDLYDELARSDVGQMSNQELLDKREKVQRAVTDATSSKADKTRLDKVNAALQKLDTEFNRRKIFKELL